MKNEYTAPEVIEVGNAAEVILGEKLGWMLEDYTAFITDSDLDE